ncbi:hypothetical protein BHQ18_11535 [Mycolicibacterium flavescens]|uniref:DUF5642 domain-containing protein n=1 Tax=Mycolicibacterium flavescens TaxID=1776 RepID=A0A1E3RJN9_MYCFV|nr:hypothetical protein BHQ18_11535 [Mycolicibacterium flavescens]
MSMLVVVVPVAGCADSQPDSETATPEAQTFDLSKLSQLEDQMPEGFIPYPSEVTKLQHMYVDGVGSVVSNGKPFTVDPPGCAVLLYPVRGQAGADTTGVRADGLERRSIAVGADMPVTVPEPVPSTGCERMTYTVPDDDHPTSGTAERIEAPAIDGATTYALKITADGYSDPEYFYTAIVDGRVYVSAEARLAPDYPAQPLMPDLLVKAVAAIRS